MNDNYRFFIRAYRGNDFIKAGRMAFNILKLLPDHESLITESWQHKLSELFLFLRATGFDFSSEDDFYEMLSVISTKVKTDADIDWRAILK